jgi:hypothetical protein
MMSMAFERAVALDRDNWIEVDRWTGCCADCVLARHLGRECRSDAFAGQPRSEDDDPDIRP